MTTPSLPDHLVRHFASLEQGPSGESAAGRALSAVDPVEAAHALNVIVGRAPSSQDAARALTLISRALLFAADADLPYTHRGRIYDAAAEFGLSSVAALFISGAAAQEVDPNASPPPVDPMVGHLSLGHKKALARQADPDRMSRLAAEGDARVIRELLLNPKLTEALVVRIVARRPVKGEVLMEVVRSGKWSVRAPVRRAMAMNPYTPVELTLKILPHLTAPDLKAIANDRALHTTVRDAARKLAGRRPPQR